MGTFADNELPNRVMVTGNPGAGKTGLLAPLVDAGFKLRILDFDGNLEPLRNFTTDKSKLANVDFLHFEDKLRVGGQFMEVNGIPTAFANALKAMDHWTYTGPDGKVVDLGSSRDWGPDTIVVLDSLTKLGDAAFRRAQKLLNKNATNTTQQVWMLAAAEQAMFIERLTSTENKHHVVVLAHLRMIAPPDIQKGDRPETEELKRRVIDLLPTRYYPRALGRELPQVIGGEFPILINVDKEVKAHKVHRLIRTVSQENMDLKVPIPNLPEVLEFPGGLLQIFEKMTPKAVAAVRGT